MKKIILLLFIALMTMSTQATLTNVFESVANVGDLVVQPVPDDLWQQPGVTSYIVYGALNGVVPDGLTALHNSPAVGDLGGAGFYGHVIFQDGMSPANDTAMNIVFDSPKSIQEIRVFTTAGDPRQFNYIEVWYSTSGTNDADFTKIGAAVTANIGDAYVGDPHCRMARLYDDTGSSIPNVTALRLIQKNVGYTTMQDPGTENGETPMGGSIDEIDIIGIPEPTFILSGLFLALAFLRRK